ncbi:MAG: lysine--tRNA ligase [Candidatus Aenigmatarchaeota archaeon]|nr:lysine--tRNA ligase [Nanoarchaeota archaeon]
MEDQLHWAFSAAKNVIKTHGKKKIYTGAAGITPSGTIHIGNFREMITVELVTRALKKMGNNVRFIYSWDDFDVFRKVPVNMPDQELLKTYLRKPIDYVPDTYDCKHKSFAEHNMEQVKCVLPIVGVNPEFIRQSIKYRNCDYADEVEYCLKKTETIKNILNKYRKEKLAKDWLPVSIFCEKCGKDTITKIEYKGSYKVYYKCECGHEDTFDFRKKGIIKLNWRIDWPMRWHYEKVNLEPAGKDHFAAGGAKESGDELQKTLWNEIPPYGFMYEWIGIKGGKEFSSSKGIVVTLHDVLEIYEPEIVRWLFAGTRPSATFNISFDLDVIKIYEDFDRCERIYFGKEEASEKEQKKQKTIYELSCPGSPPKTMPVQPSFRNVTYMLQTYIDEDKTFNHFKKDAKNRFDEERIKKRIWYAKNWLEKYAPEEFRFTVRKDFNKEYYGKLGKNEKEALSRLADVLDKFNGSPDDLATLIFEIPKATGVNTGDFFKVVYNMIIGKDRGPKLAGFIMDVGIKKVKGLLR